jgi:transcriptional regulator with XRE-family HTH domain
MTTETTRRRELHDFLRAARSRLEPEDIGIRPGQNRRRSGLHQADVAAALAVSGRWYNAFENSTGHGPPDPGLLDRLSGILQLTPAERVRLYLLAAGHEPAPATTDTHSHAPGERAALERLVGLAGPDLPALLCDVAWNILAWNQALSRRVLDPGALPAADRNLILWLLTPAARQSVSDISAVRDEEIGRVHLALARYPGDPKLALLVARLQQIPAARRLWLRQHIPGPIPITPRRIQPQGSGAPTGSDLVSAEFPGRLRLLILVPRSDWPPGRARPQDNVLPEGTRPGTTNEASGQVPSILRDAARASPTAPLYTEPGAQQDRNQAPQACPDSALCPGM